MYVSSEIVAGLHDMILLVDGYSAILLFVESGLGGLDSLLPYMVKIQKNLYH
jgi:hypothetical protein